MCMMCEPGSRNLFHLRAEARPQWDNETPLRADEDADGGGEEEEEEDDEEEGGNRGERGSVAFPSVTHKKRKWKLLNRK